MIIYDLKKNRKKLALHLVTGLTLLEMFPSGLFRGILLIFSSTISNRLLKNSVYVILLMTTHRSLVDFFSYFQ